jgi:hypothetical protein
MQFVVLPLSRLPARRFDPEGFAVQSVIHMFCVGLPIALAIRRFGPPQGAR